MGPYKVIQVIDLITCKGNKRPLDSSEFKSPFSPVLFGTLSLETQLIAPYCKTFTFEDKTGKLRCYCPKYEETWLQRNVCIYAWNVVPQSYSLDETRGLLSVALELLVEPIAVDAELFLQQFAMGSFTLKELEQLQVIGNQPHIEASILTDCKPVTVPQIHHELSQTTEVITPSIENERNLFVHARVKSKSVLHRKKHSTICFFIEIEEADLQNFKQVSTFIVFKGLHVVEQFYRIEVNEKYLFAKLKIQSIFTGKPYSKKVLAFDDQVTKVIEETHPIVEIYLEKFSNVLQSNSYPSQDSSVTDSLYIWPHIEPDKSSIVRSAVITYTGNITQVIDIVLGIFVLDRKYLLYLSHDPSYTPFNGLRVGAEIRLFNVHILVFDKTSEISQVYFKRFLDETPNYAIFVGCTYSTVNIVAFSGDVVETRLPKFGSKFAPPRSRTRFNVIDLIHYQTIYFRMKDKFPGAFEDSHLLGPFDIGEPKHPELDANSSILVLLLSKLGYTPYTRDLYREFFEHHEHCSTCVERYSSFAFPLLKDVLETGSLNIGGGATSTVDGVNFNSKVSICIVNKRDDMLGKINLLGVLQGAPNGELQLRDQSGEVYATILRNHEETSGNLLPEHLNNIWAIPEFEIIAENLGINPTNADTKLTKLYVRFDISRAFCISKRDSEKTSPTSFMSNQTSRYLFRVKHIFPVKISFGINNDAELSTFVEGIGYAIHDSTISQSHFDTLASAQPMFLRFTGDSMSLFPSLKVEKTYMCQYILPFQESSAACGSRVETEPSKPQRSSRNQSNISKLNAFLVKPYSKIEIAMASTEIVAHRPDQYLTPPSGASHVEQKTGNEEIAEQSEEPILEVGEIFALFEEEMAAEEIKHGLKEVGKVGKMISFRGKILKKEIKPSKVRSFYTNEWHLFAFQKFGIGTGKGKQTVLLKIQDLANATTIDFYLDLDKFTFPLGVIPGQIITVRKAALKYSESGNIYTLFTPCTYISTGTEKSIPTSLLDRLEESENIFASVVDSRFLVEMQKEKKKIFKCRCRIVEIQEITLRTTCINCENIVRQGRCLLGCKQAEVSICGEAKVNVEDGTLEAQVIFQEKEEIFKLLKLSNRMMERLTGVIEKSGELSYRSTPHWQTNLDTELFNDPEAEMIDAKTDEEQFLQLLCVGNRVKNEVVLLVQKIKGGDPNWKAEKIDANNTVRPAYYVRTVRLPGSMSIQTLASPKLILKAMKLQEVATLTETLLTLNELENLLIS